MRTLVSIAWRNLGRNRRRTFITALAIAVGVGLCVATYGLTDGLNAQMVRAVTRLDLGHVQVHHPDYPSQRLLRATIGPRAQVTAAAAALDGVRGVAPRAYAWALASHDGTSTGLELVGVLPDEERKVTALLDLVVEGDGLRDAPTPWPAGRAPTAEEKAWDEAATARATAAALDELDALGALDEGAAPAVAPAAPTADDLRGATRALVRDLSPPPREPPPVLLGDRLAHALRAEPGDEVYLLTSTLDGVAAEERFRVAGVFRTGTASLDRTRAYLHLADLQRFVRLDDRVHEIAIGLAGATQAEEAAATLRRDLAGTEGALVRSWQEVRPLIQRLLDLNAASVSILLTIIFIVAALGVVNTMLMAVFERTRELGVLMALGFRPGQVRWLIVFETLALTVAGGLAGTLLGLGLDAWFLFHGWDLRWVTDGFSYGGVGLDPVLRAAVTTRGVVAPLVAMSVVSFLASFYPARRAARLKPTEAMRAV